MFLKLQTERSATNGLACLLGGMEIWDGSWSLYVLRTTRLTTPYRRLRRDAMRCNQVRLTWMSGYHPADNYIVRRVTISINEAQQLPWNTPQNAVIHSKTQLGPKLGLITSKRSRPELNRGRRKLQTLIVQNPKCLPLHHETEIWPLRLLKKNTNNRSFIITSSSELVLPLHCLSLHLVRNGRQSSKPRRILVFLLSTHPVRPT